MTAFLVVLALVVAAVVAVLVSGVFDTQSDGALNRIVARRRKAAGLRPIGEAEGPCRVLGKVVVLDDVPGYPKMGAFFARSAGTSLPREVRRRRSVVLYKSEQTRVTDMTRVGRFAVVDDTGAAIVEDGDALVWARDAAQIPEAGNASLLVREGTEVEIVGVAEPGPLPPKLASLGGYRGTGNAAYMRAAGKDRLLILV